MLLALDVGNTNLVFGLLDAAGNPGVSWRVPTGEAADPGSLQQAVSEQLAAAAIGPEMIEVLVVASVVPAVNPAIAKLAKTQSWQLIMAGEAGVRLGIGVDVENPAEVGADRLVNALGAQGLGMIPSIIIDFGTATTFDLVLADASGAPVYAGGIIAPGVNLSVEALSRAAAKLPEMDIQNWQAADVPVPGRSTEQAMRAGVLWGYAGLAEGLIARLQEQLGEQVPVIATGGLASLYAPHISAIGQVAPDLTLIGLFQLYQINKAG